MSRLPNLKPRDIAAALKKAGFLSHHQKGSHEYFWHPLKRRMTCVSQHPGDIHRNIFKKILKQAELTENEFRRLL